MRDCEKCLDSVTMNAEDFRKIIEETAKATAEHSAKANRETVFGLFGLEDNIEGKEVLHCIGQDAKKSFVFWKKFFTKSEDAFISTVIKGVAGLILIALSVIAVKLGLDEYIKF